MTEELVFNTPKEAGVVFTEEKPGLVYIKFTYYSPVPIINGAQAKYYLSQIQAALIKSPDRLVDFIIDTTLVTPKVRSLSQQARAAYTEAFKQPGVGKITLVGMGPWLKGMIMVFVQITGQAGKTAFFDTKQEAAAWIATNKKT